MGKKNFLKNPSFYYYLFVVIATLELIVSLLGIFLPIGSRENSISNVFLSILAISLMSLPRFLKDKYNLKFKGWIEIIILIFLFASIVLGFIQEFYEHITGYDKIVHILGGVVLSLVAFELVHIYSNYISKKKNQKIPALFTILFSFTFSITLLVLWEFYEFLADTLSYNFFSTNTNMQRYKWSNDNSFFPQSYGLLDTMLDLILGALGSAVVSVILFIILRRDEKKELHNLAIKDKAREKETTV